MSDVAPPAAPQEHRYPCEQCGSDYRFAPGKGALICDHCGHREDISAGPWGHATLKELDFDAAVASKLPETEIEELRVLTCPNCAAEIEFDPDSHAAECPFCATPVVTDTGTHRYIKPRGVLPFAMDERTAHAAMSDWLGKLWFAPDGLQEYARKGRKMQGIYAPYWTYDADTKSSYRGEHGTVYYVSRTVTRNGKTSTERVQKIRWRPASGRVARFFDDILVLASRSLPKKYTDGLSPWDLSALEPYQPQYLAGLRAEGYTVELDEGYSEARQHMASVIERDVRFDIGGDRQRIHNIDTDISDVTFKHILLPVWLAAYKYRGTTYRFVVNGQSGRVQGERPWSVIKITIAVTLGLLVAAGAGYLIAINQ
ncbi:MAG: TFIIB-type zinc finger domain-containing protein [Rhodobacteraceae bacterium]|nr:TFIIB-type zinc finger domain-containing protein [Paracoccaceae bacterium]